MFVAMTGPLARVMIMIMILVIHGFIESTLSKRYPYIDGDRNSTESNISAVLCLVVLVQPLLLPSFGLTHPSFWFVISGFFLSVLGGIGYILSKHALGVHSVNEVVPPNGYVSSGIYCYLRHPMYVSLSQCPYLVGVRSFAGDFCPPGAGVGNNPLLVEAR